MCARSSGVRALPCGPMVLATCSSSSTPPVSMPCQHAVCTEGIDQIKAILLYTHCTVLSTAKSGIAGLTLAPRAHKGCLRSTPRFSVCTARCLLLILLLRCCFKYRDSRSRVHIDVDAGRYLQPCSVPSAPPWTCLAPINIIIIICTLHQFEHHS